MKRSKQNNNPDINRGWLVSLLVIVCVVLANASESQILQGKWVDESQAAIEQHRKTDVTVIVLDRQDRAVQGAKVRLVQQRHDFALGLTLPSDRKPPKAMGTLQVYRCFNAIALDRYTDWQIASDTDAGIATARLNDWVAAIEPLHRHFGPVISADPAQNHDRLSLLAPADLRDAILARIDLVSLYDPKPDSYDLYADVLKQDMIERKLGQGMLPRMFDRAAARQPKASFGVRVRNAISLQAGRDLVSTIQKLEVRQVPFDHVTIEQQFRSPIQPNALRRMLDEYAAPLPVPVTLAGIEVSGPTPVAAAIKLETLLRLAFAQPNIDAIYFAGLIDEDLIENNAALIGDDGKPTASGEVLDALFTKLWHSDESGTSDERGNVESRVFMGWYHVIATLPDGTVVKSEAYIPKSERAKRIILQATAAEAK
ncbi:MAG: hypothetical protein AB8C95_04595 [Phycisphaeraceae bacterium]